MHQPMHDNPLIELKRIQAELHFERGVLWAIKEVQRGEDVKELAFLSAQRVRVLTELAEKLKRSVR